MITHRVVSVCTRTATVSNSTSNARYFILIMMKDGETSRDFAESNKNHRTESKRFSVILKEISFFRLSQLHRSDRSQRWCRQGAGAGITNQM